MSANRDMYEYIGAHSINATTPVRCSENRVLYAYVCASRDRTWRRWWSSVEARSRCGARCRFGCVKSDCNGQVGQALGEDASGHACVRAKANKRPQL